MGILLLLIGILSVASGAFKMRERVRSYFGSSSLAFAEIVGGGLIIIASGAGLSRLRPAAWTAVAVVLALIVVSSSAHARRAAQHRRRREQSAEARLETYVQSDAYPPKEIARRDGKSKRQH